MGKGSSPGQPVQRLLRAVEPLLGADAIPGLEDSGPARPDPASLVIRLAFLWFLQESGRLAGDRDFLRRQLDASGRRGADRYYAEVLLPLLFLGIGRPRGERGRFESRLSGVPFLGRRLITPTAAERNAGISAPALDAGRQPETAVPDDWFRRLFELFRGVSWDAAREGPEGGRVTPAVLGRLCERNGPRRLKGAYYTGQDVARYICRATILPALLSELPPGACRIGCRGVDPYLPASRKLPDLHLLETPEELEERLRRCEAVRRRHPAGSTVSPDQFVTANLDLELLARETIAALPEGERRALGRRLRRLRVLDPTCGSGDFLLAALETLLPLHAACADRPSGEPPARDRGPDARSIAAASLYGLDLDEAAVEACRFRLLLRLLDGCPAVETGSLPDLGRTVRHGNAVSGFSELPQPAAGPMCRARLDGALLRLLRERGETGGSDTPAEFAARRPFHWPFEFPEAAASGGFDVVVGNPPYVDARPARREYGIPDFATAACASVYAWVVERSLRLLNERGRLGMVIPVSAVSGPGYQPLADLLLRNTCWLSTFSNRPARLFAGVEQRLAIVLTAPSGSPTLLAAPYQHWYEGERPRLFDRLEYWPASRWTHTGMPLKSGSPAAERVWKRLLRRAGRLGELAGDGEGEVWLHDGPTYWVRALSFPPGEQAGGGHYHRISAPTRRDALLLAAVLSSSTFYLYFKMVGNCRDLGRREWESFPFGPAGEELRDALAGLGEQLEARLRATATVRTRLYPSGQVTYREYYPSLARPILDAIDALLARHYRIGLEDLRFICQNDIKYRMAHRREGAADGGFGYS